MKRLACSAVIGPMALLVCVQSIAGDVCRRQPSKTKKPSLAQPVVPVDRRLEPVQGRVVLPDGKVIQGLRVRLGEQNVETEGDGRFSFNDVPATYDLKISDRDGRRVTAYYGLTRRNPLVAHSAGNTSEPQGKRHHATVAGWLQVDQQILRYSAPPMVYILSPSTFAEAKGSFPRPGEMQSAYLPVQVDWSGESAMNGTLLALIRGQESAYLATIPIGIADGDALRRDIRLTPIAMGRIEGSVQMHSGRGEWPGPESLKVGYAVPGVVGVIDLGKCGYSDNLTFHCKVPDLSALGGEYCLSIISHIGHGEHVRANRCGAKIGMRDFSMPPMPPIPHLNSGDSVASPGDMVSWTEPAQSGRSLYQVQIGTCLQGACGIAYLTQTSFSWFELQELELRYHPGLTKDVSVSALYPYTTTDELAAGGELFGQRANWQRVASAPIRMSMPDTASPVAVEDRVDAGNFSTCLSTSEAVPVSAIRTTMVETRIAVRGILTLGAWGCTQMGCEGGGRCCVNGCWANWVMEHPTARTHNVELLQDLRPLGGERANECDLPKAPRFEVIASGVLLQAESYPPFRRPYSLDVTSLCAVRPATSPNVR